MYIYVFCVSNDLSASTIRRTLFITCMSTPLLPLPFLPLNVSYLCVQKKIVWLDVAVNKTQLVNGTDGKNGLPNVEACYKKSVSVFDCERIHERKEMKKRFRLHI